MVTPEEMLDLLTAAAMTISVADAAAVLLLGEADRLALSARRGCRMIFPRGKSRWTGKPFRAVPYGPARRTARTFPSRPVFRFSSVCP
jgi:hypothetical protein